LSTGVLLIHGTMGSVLKQEGKKVWPLHYGSLDHYRKSLIPLSNNVEPSHMLITYKRLMNELKKTFPVVEEFLYDWRLNNVDHSNLLKEKIENMVCDEVHIVAHSMGGIVAKICLNKFEEEESIKKVTKLITLGTPWKGSMESVKTLLYGSRIPQKYIKFMDKGTSKEISTYFPSVYQLLPTQGYLDQLKSLNCIPYYFNDCYYDNFEDFFQNNLHRKFSEQHEYHLIYNEYYELLNKRLSPDIELHEIIGTSKPTMRMICENTRKEPYVNYDDGDGTVPLFSAYSNYSDSENYHSYFVKKATHNGMPLNPKIINLIKSIISGEEFEENHEIFTNLQSAYYQRFSGYISKVACPVDISIRDQDGNIIYGNIETISDEEIRELLLTDYEVEDIGTTTYVIFDEEDETSISNYKGLVIDAYDKGLTSISLEKYDNGILIKRNAFKTFEINPYMQAELVLEEVTEESSLILKKNGIVEQEMELYDLSLDEGEVIPPTTKISFSGDNLNQYENKNVFFGKDIITMHIDAIVEGSFTPKITYALINGKTLIVDDKLILDKSILKHGKNEIEVFTIDEYDYNERKNTVTFYYFYQLTTKVEYLFKDKFYLVHLGEDETYNRVANAYQLPHIKPIYKFDKENDVTGHQVSYNGIERNLEITYNDIFNNSYNFTSKINEKIVKKIIKGAASVSDVEKFVEDLNLEINNYQFHLNKPGNHKLLNDNNLNGSHSFEIFSDDSYVKIVKNVELDVSFESLSEHISVKSNTDNYNFIFKVIDIDEEYVENLDLAGEVTFTIEEDTGLKNKEFKESFNIDYIPTSASYSLIINLSGLKEILEGFWKPEDKILGTAKLEILNNNNNSVIRSLDLKIAK
jgi:pimeloyl-ACP methyl ester carboxylesterase